MVGRNAATTFSSWFDTEQGDLPSKLLQRSLLEAPAHFDGLAGSVVAADTAGVCAISIDFGSNDFLDTDRYLKPGEDIASINASSDGAVVELSRSDQGKKIEVQLSGAQRELIDGWHRTEIRFLTSLNRKGMIAFRLVAPTST